MLQLRHRVELASESFTEQSMQVYRRLRVVLAGGTGTPIKSSFAISIGSVMKSSRAASLDLIRVLTASCRLMFALPKHAIGMTDLAG